MMDFDYLLHFEIFLTRQPLRVLPRTDGPLRLGKVVEIVVVVLVVEIVAGIVDFDSDRKWGVMKGVVG